MESETESHSKILIILILAVIAGLIYLLSLFLAYPEFQNTRLADALAEINSLFPLYYIAIVLAALSVVACLIWRVGNRYLHILLLMMFAAMLWLTPYYLAGFVRHPDSPWHVGVAMSAPEVLGGDPVAFSGYAWYHPGSFIYHYCFVSIVGIEPLTYINLFPPICLVLFVLLCYLLVAKLFDPKVALLSMLIAIPGLHYLQLHASPHTIGALLMLTTLLLLSRRRAVAKVIPVVGILGIIIITTHPTTPLLLSIFLAAALLTSVVHSRRIGPVQMVLAGILVVCFAGWFSWHSFYPASPWKDEGTLYQLVMPGQLEVGPEFLTGTQFIYSSIYNLNKGVYFFYATLAVLGVVYIAARDYSEKRGIKNWASKLGGLKRSEALLALSIPILLILAFLLAEKAHDLIETGLTYIILALSCIIASVIARLHWLDRGIGRSFLAIGVLLLTLSFPVVAYSIDAYSSFPESEEDGLKFLVEEGSLKGKTIAGSDLRQLALYAQPPLSQTETMNFGALGELDLSEKPPDMIVFRNTGYYYAAMRHELSFEDNRFTEYLAVVESSNYHKIYSSPTFEVYSKGGVR